MLISYLQKRYPKHEKLLFYISVLIDISTYAVLLYVWFFGIKQFCTPDQVCPEVLRSCGQNLMNLQNISKLGINTSFYMANITP